MSADIDKGAWVHTPVDVKCRKPEMRLVPIWCLAVIGEEEATEQIRSKCGTH